MKATNPAEVIQQICEPLYEAIVEYRGIDINSKGLGGKGVTKTVSPTPDRCLRLQKVLKLRGQW
jgi:hypothetical protein